MKKFLSTFLVLWLTWMLLAGFSAEEAILGGAASLILALIIVRFVPFSFGIGIVWQAIRFVVIYIPLFLYKMVLSNIDVAYRVLSPKMPINPRIVKVPTNLKGDVAKLILANSITLTPGTLSLDVEDDGVLVHWINASGETGEEYQNKISREFETVLGRLEK
ncbi:MAG: Na+/H+ antiporter subunit D [Clostridiales bacterium]|nr:Na+/H+ antiporter subunit D [Clostridiales bacterium]